VNELIESSQQRPFDMRFPSVSISPPSNHEHRRTFASAPLKPHPGNLRSSIRSAAQSSRTKPSVTSRNSSYSTRRAFSLSISPAYVTHGLYYLIPDVGAIAKSTRGKVIERKISLLSEYLFFFSPRFSRACRVEMYAAMKIIQNLYGI
jgi:hypothetical protein